MRKRKIRFSLRYKHGKSSFSATSGWCKEGDEYKRLGVCGPKNPAANPSPASAPTTNSVPAAVASGVPAGMYCPACPICPIK